MDSLFSYVLFQANWYVFTLILTIGVVVYLLPYKFSKLANSGAYRAINFIALVAIVIGTINLGYWGSDQGWGRNKVLEDRQNEIRQLQQLARKR